MNLTLSTSVQYIPRVGPAMAAKLAKLDIFTVEDLLLSIPFRYNDFSLTVPIAGLQPGEVVTISGTISSITNVITKSGKRMQRAVVSDGSKSMPVIWFNQPFLMQTLNEGQKVYLAGKVDWFGRDIVMISPEYELPTSTQGLHTGRLVPVYSVTEGVSPKWIRGRIAYLLDTVSLNEYLSKDILAAYNLVDFPHALKEIHFPTQKQNVDTAKRRLAFDELLIWQLRAKIERRTWITTMKAQPLHLPPKDATNIINALPFSLTNDQKQAIDEILTDLSKPIPMNRLLVGDVGSGKTVVATLAMYAALKNGASSLLMAPTEILAQQHFATISSLVSTIGLHAHLLTGSTKEKKPDKIGVYIGTQAILSRSRLIPRIGFVVIDEQHRFGVSQRSQLTGIKKGFFPHLLTMTATPIPRTMAKVLFANVDVSTLLHLPSGRTKIKTWVTPKHKREAAYAWIADQIAKTHGQAFIICPLVDESETLATVRAVTTEYNGLQKVFPKLLLGLLHGRMKPKEKEEILAAMRHGDINILVATPVVEVGIDIPNATIMMIEAAERFGLAQLHQLRGRVGRGSLPSFCLLFTEDENPKTQLRLKALETMYSGPALAEVDLTLRGPGDLLGTRQHGLPTLKIATLSDTKLIAQTKIAAAELLARDEDLNGYPLLRERLKKGTIQEAKSD